MDTTTDDDHRCRYCFEKFLNPKHLTSHLRLHFKNGDFHSCYFCGLRIRRKDNYDSHLRTHTGELQYPCEFCGRSFMNPGNYSRHTCEILNCEFCGKYYNIGRRLLNHINEVHNNVDTSPVNCTVCRVGFPDLEQYERHVLDLGHVRKAQQQNSLSVSFNVVGSGQRHHHQEDGYISAPQQSKVPSLFKPSPCKTCCKDFPSTNSLNVHYGTREHKLQALKLKIKKVKDKLKRIKSKTTTTGGGQRPIDDNRNNEETYCQICDKVYLNKVRYRDHVYTQHKGKEMRKRWCQPCGRFISCAAKFRRHLTSMTHQFNAAGEKEGAAAASIPSSFSSGSVVAGVVEHHPQHQAQMMRLNGLKPNLVQNHPCTTCGRSFGSRNSLNRHKYKVHRAPVNTDPHPSKHTYPYQLPAQLDKNNGAGEEASFKTFKATPPTTQPKPTHATIKRRQKGSGIHTCHICLKSYHDKSTLIHHMPVHTKQHECSVCKKCFRDGHDLNKHVLTHKNPNGRNHVVSL